MLAEQMHNQGNPAPLEALCRDLLQDDHGNAYACANLGVLLEAKYEFGQALALYEAGLAAHPDNFELNFNLGNLLRRLGENERALAYASTAVELAPGDALAWLSLASLARQTRRFDDSLQACQKALAISPDQPLALTHLANYYLDTGRPGEAIRHYRKALAIAPDAELAHSNMLLAMQYDAETPLQEVVDASAAYARKIGDEAKDPAPFPNDPAPWRRLRLGFVSGDFRSHAAAYFLEPLLARLDRSQFELFGYNTHTTSDVVTERLSRYFDRFQSFASFDTDARCRQIRDDRIDVLIDLSGHTSGHALHVLACKPAPVQVTWLGYPGTTGLSSIDIRITDEVADACARDGEYSEALYYLPAPFCVYRPCIRNPLQRYWPDYQVKPTPALSNGFITFGTCNNLSKLSKQTLDAWGRLLGRMANAKLLIEANGLENPEVRRSLVERCTRSGIDESRLILIPRTSTNQYLTYHQIDIALDPFPLTGGTTTFDTLWMGVPLVSMIGDSYRSRISTSLLTATGLGEWLASDEAEYLGKAVALASDVNALNQLRLSLREHVERGPLMDEQRFAVYFDNALRQAWINWCNHQGAEVAPAPVTPQQQAQVFISNGNRVPLEQELAPLARSVAEHNWPRVYQQAERILGCLPRQPDALAALAEADFANGHTMAVCYLSNALDAAPDRPEYYLRLMEMLIAQGEHAAAQGIAALAEARFQPQ
ncbi:tetratricopeptide repeat protein [Jeongeupia sp. USM3]|uniref:O-linked N-acetylglucosamine transferase, SPINDLY family protein n=1 Tax=Jeongeupia sp. USM3 TaxID=1906741 RepID=UPI00089E07F9|nr:tetratricopeptide repeat protein [Jeongeupia sp. USM3]AOX99302.1 hypothetical protein BJP62_01840 [Jeongeupia sp. USM3]